MKSGSLPPGTAEENQTPSNSTASFKEQCPRCDGTGFVNYEDEPEVCAICHGLGYTEFVAIKGKRILTRTTS